MRKTSNDHLTMMKGGKIGVGKCAVEGIQERASARLWIVWREKDIDFTEAEGSLVMP